MSSPTPSLRLLSFKGAALSRGCSQQNLRRELKREAEAGHYVPEAIYLNGRVHFRLDEFERYLAELIERARSAPKPDKQENVIRLNSSAAREKAERSLAERHRRAKSAGRRGRRT